jgi:hypothetical protein
MLLHKNEVPYCASISICLFSFIVKNIYLNNGDHYFTVASEAKRLLTYGDLSVKEVAYQLGFNDPFYFSNFFKKQTKLSPKLYKEKFAV